MSHEDPRGRSERDHGRGAYTPPTDDDLPFNRGYDARRAPSGPSRPPVTLMVSVAVLLALIVVVVLFYRSGLRASEDAPPAVGEPVGELRVEAPVDAQPVDPEAGVSVYADAQTRLKEPRHLEQLIRSLDGLDWFSAAKDGPLVAYRWSGGPLSDRDFVSFTG